MAQRILPNGTILGCYHLAGTMDTMHGMITIRVTTPHRSEGVPGQNATHRRSRAKRGGVAKEVGTGGRKEGVSINLPLANVAYPLANVANPPRNYTRPTTGLCKFPPDRQYLVVSSARNVNCMRRENITRSR